LTRFFIFHEKPVKNTIPINVYEGFVTRQKTGFFAVIQKLFFKLEKRRLFGPAIPQAQRADMFIVTEH
jgi:hypothetical protein